MPRIFVHRDPALNDTEDEPEYSAYTCACCGRDDREVEVVYDRFAQRRICVPCWNAEDDAVEAAERRASRC